MQYSVPCFSPALIHAIHRSVSVIKTAERLEEKVPKLGTISFVLFPMLGDARLTFLTFKKARPKVLASISESDHFQLGLDMEI